MQNATITFPDYTHMGVDTGPILLAHFITVTLQKIDNSLIAELISIKHINIIIFCQTLQNVIIVHVLPDHARKRSVYTG